MSRNTRKQEVASKVKEIKQRQQNWMKQRAECQEGIKNDSPTIEPDQSFKGIHSPSKSRESLRSSKKESVDQSNNLGNLLASKISKAKFENWLKAKQTDQSEHQSDPLDIRNHTDRYHDNNKYDRNNYTDSNYGNNLYRDESYRDHQGSKEVNVLRIPSSRSPDYATPDPSWNSEDETGEITAAQLLSPEDFNTVADSIINKVKGDLGIGNRKKSVTTVKTSHETSLRDEHYGKSRATKSGDGLSRKNVSKANVGKANHVCPTCDKLMVPPQYSPMLLVPCGHTLCKHCSKRTKHCGMCGSGVETYTPNTMLEQIITNYNSNQNKYSAQELSEHEPKDIRQYREEYRNLQTREDILQEESDNINGKMIKLSQQLSVQNQQIDNIQNQEGKISEEIQNLQEKLRTLHEHRLEYEQNCDKLQTEYKQEKNRLLMIKESIDSIRKQKEKVKILAESEY